MSDAPFISADAARTLLLHGQGLLREPLSAATPASTLKLIEDLGFVQLDSINIVERAHHHILWTRMRGYRPPLLDALQRKGRVFEHWTHDASLIPSRWFPHWRHRFDRATNSKWLRRQLGDGHETVLAHVIERIQSQGPVMARDFEQPGRKSGTWWDWKPAKAALEFWWRSGRLAIPHRDGFQKVYDLTERVLPKVCTLPTPEHAEHVDWACRTALDRIGVGTPREIAAFWNAITHIEAAAWCKRAVASGEVVAVRVGAIVGPERASFAWRDWRKRVSKAGEPPRGVRLLSPFDPVIRDRVRCQRLFGFDYRFEAFVPEPKRKYGYYILPLLEGERLVGRIDPKVDRDSGTLHVKRVWWEPKIKPTRARLRSLESALEHFAALSNAERIEIHPPAGLAG